MRIITGGELLLSVLADCGIKQVFSIAGEQLGTVYDAFGKFPEINLTVPRSETSAALMASGYSASTGYASVSMATVGAGVVYEVAGLSKAWFNYLPVISIAPQLQSWKIKPHQENLQGCNQDEIFYPITKWNSIIYSWERIPQIVYRAFREALQGIQGPVHIDIPSDVLFRYKILTEKKRRKIMPPAEKTMYRGNIKGDPFFLKKACDAIKESERPVITLGQGFGRPGRYQEIKQDLNRLGIPVITTTISSGALCGEDNCYAGDISLFISAASGLELLKRTDLLLVIGMDPYSEHALSIIKDSPNLKGVIQIEIDPSSFKDNITNLCPVHSDPHSSLSYFERELKWNETDLSTWRDDFNKNCDLLALELSKELKNLDELFDSLKDISSCNDIFIVDGRELSLAASCFLRKAVYKNLFIMDDRDLPGAGLPFALGAVIGNPNDNVVLISDKDSLFHHIRELQSAVSIGLEFTIICVDDISNNNVADSSLVLQSMGCNVKEVDRLSIKRDDIFKTKKNIPNAFILKSKSNSPN